MDSLQAKGEIVKNSNAKSQQCITKGRGRKHKGVYSNISTRIMIGCQARQKTRHCQAARKENQYKNSNQEFVKANFVGGKCPSSL